MSSFHRAPPLQERAWIRSIAGDWLFSDIESVPEVVLLPCENPDLFDESVFTRHLDVEQRHTSISVAKWQGALIGVASPKFGAPAIAMTVEALADRGVRRLIAVGYCGAISSAIRSGDLVLPQACGAR